GGGPVAGLEMGRDLGGQVALVGLQLADLPHEPLGEAGMGGQALIEVADLLAQVLLLQFQQGLGVLLLDAGDEQVEKRFEQIGDASDHEAVPLLSPRPRQHGAARPESQFATDSCCVPGKPAAVAPQQEIIDSLEPHPEVPMPDPLEFYFDFSSPYGYLASTRIDALASKHGRAVTWRPYLLGVAFKATGQAPLVEQPLRGPYHVRDF